MSQDTKLVLNTLSKAFRGTKQRASELREVGQSYGSKNFTEVIWFWMFENWARSSFLD